MRKVQGPGPSGYVGGLADAQCRRLRLARSPVATVCDGDVAVSNVGASTMYGVGGEPVPAGTGRRIPGRFNPPAAGRGEQQSSPATAKCVTPVYSMRAVERRPRLPERRAELGEDGSDSSPLLDQRGRRRRADARCRRGSASRRGCVAWRAPPAPSGRSGALREGTLTTVVAW
jgi:hypothetical protein